MWETIKNEWFAKVLVAFFLIYSLWFLYFHLPGVDGATHYDWYTVSYGLIAAIGSVYGVYVAQKWGMFSSIMGKAILFFSIGLALQEVGQLGYTYYIYYLQIDIPYPSWGDIAFYGSIPFYIVAIFYLAKAAGVKLSLKSFGGKIQSILIPVAMLLMSHFVFLQGYVFDWSAPLTTILDFGVPFAQAIYISLAILTYTLTRGVLGGMMKTKVLFILFALMAQYIADWTFLYQASRGTWSVSGVNDYMYFVAYFLMGFGLLQLKVVYSKLSQERLVK